MRWALMARRGPFRACGEATVMTGTPYLNQLHVHDIFRRWRKVADEYADSEQGPRVFVSEAWVTPATQLAQYIRSEKLQTTSTSTPCSANGRQRRSGT
jgi:hypothetical protein